MAEPNKTPTTTATGKVARPDDEIEALIRERQALHLILFPGDEERALRLGHDYEEACARVVDFVLKLETSERSRVVRSFQADIASVVQRLSKPRRAPMLWSERETDSQLNPASFTRKYYSRWLPGMTRKDLHDLDPQLYRALSVWEHRHPEDRIAELPTLTEVIDQKISALGAEFSEDELRKLGTTLQTRLRRLKK